MADRVLEHVFKFKKEPDGSCKPVGEPVVFKIKDEKASEKDKQEVGGIVIESCETPGPDKGAPAGEISAEGKGEKKEEPKADGVEEAKKTPGKDDKKEPGFLQRVMAKLRKI